MKIHPLRIFLLLMLLLLLGASASDYTLVAQLDNAKVERWMIQPEFEELAVGERIPNIVLHKELKRPKIGLVLSGGGARGIAAVGVLKSFHKHNIPIDFITGTSMGSIVGGLYAAGYSVDQLEELVKTTDWNDLLAIGEDTRRRDLFLDQKIAEDRSILVLRFDKFQPILPEAFSTGQRLTDRLNILALQGIYHPDPSFDALRIPYRAVATDLVSGKKVVIDQGSLALAMRASITIPLLFNSVKMDSFQLLDGGLVANIPVDVAREWGADIVIAVDVSSPLRPAEKLNAPWEIADQITSIMMQFSNRLQLDQADIIIRPAIGNHLSSDFTNPLGLVEAGEASADSALPIIQALIHEHYRYALEESLSGRDFSSKHLEYDRSELSPAWSTKLDELTAQFEINELKAKQIVTDLYASGRFKEVEMVAEKTGNDVRLILQTIPNPILHSVSITGNRYISKDSLLMVFRPFLGKQINAREGQAVLERLLGLYRERGLSLARVRRIEFDEEKGHVQIYIDEGRIHRRTIHGTKKTKDYVIWRELPFEEKDVFQVSKIEEGLKNLYSTSLFEQVLMTIQLEGDSAQHNVLVINARERHTELMRIGLRLDNERNLQPSIDLRDENFLGIGSELGFRFVGGLRNRLYNAEFKAVRIFNTYLTFSLKGYYSLYDVNVFDNDPLNTKTRWNRIRVGEFRETRDGIKIVFGTQLARLGSVTIEGRLENQKLWNIFGKSIKEENLRVSTLKFGSMIDSQDRYPFPQDGVVMNFSYETPFVKRREGIGFTKMLFSYETIHTPAKGHTIRPKVLFGFADETLPLTEQFSLGGQHSFFGLREDDSRGRQIFISSFEYRFNLPIKLLFNSFLKVRYDLGSIWKTPEEIRLKDLRHGIGLSLSLDTPIGPAEMSVGRSFYIRKDLFEQPLSFGPVLVYFSIGY